MKTKVFVGLVVMFFLVCGSLAQAGIIDNAIGFITDQETQTGIYYSFDDKETHGYVGRTIAKNVMVDKLDLALVWDLKDAIGAEANYSIKEGDISPYVGVIVGTDRIESLDSDLGQIFFAVSAGCKF